ncbi:MAG TPA: polymorphic toxin-type HINT domain-containing protein [Polyangia bacterium]
MVSPPRTSRWHSNGHRPGCWCGPRDVLGDRRGSAVIDKIVIIGLFVFGIVCGVRWLSLSSNVALDCQGQTVTAVGTGSGVSPCKGRDQLESAAASGNLKMCFVAGTPVMTKAGLRPIETLEPGALVLSRDVATGAVVFKPIVRVHESRSRALVRLITQRPDGAHEAIETTASHPFLVAAEAPTEERWKDARTLIPGRDRLIGQDHQIPIIAAEFRAVSRPVYNLEVADHHSFYVGHSEVVVKAAPAVEAHALMPGTRVLTQAGPRAIEEIAPGTLVLAREERGAVTDWKPVLRRFTSQIRSILRLELDQLHGVHEVLEASPEQVFHVFGAGWLPARDLVAGVDVLLDERGRKRSLAAVTRRPQISVGHTLEVADFHSFFAGEGRIWTHNAPWDDTVLRVRLRMKRPGPRAPIMLPPAFGSQTVIANVTPIGNGQYAFSATLPGGRVLTGRTDAAGRGRILNEFRDLTINGIRTRVAVDWSDGLGLFSDTFGNAYVIGRVDNAGNVSEMMRWQSVQLPGQAAPVDALIVSQGPTGSQFEAILPHTTVSGTLSPAGVATLNPAPPPPPAYQPGSPINGVRPTVDPAGAYTQVGNLRIFRPRVDPNNPEYAPLIQATPPGGDPADTFVNGVLADLQMMASTQSGRALLDSIQNHGGPTAQPIAIIYASGNGPNNQAKAVAKGNAHWRADHQQPNSGGYAVMRYNPFRSGMLLPGRPTSPPTVSWINDQLAFIRPLGPNANEWGRAQNKPAHVTAFHELIHADDAHRGRTVETTAPGATNGTGEERAVGIGDFSGVRFSENSYRGELNLPVRNFYYHPGELYSTAAGRGFHVGPYMNEAEPNAVFDGTFASQIPLGMVQCF